MRTPTQQEIDIWFSARRTLAQEIDKAIADAKRGKKSVEKAVLDTINLKTWHLRAEAKGFYAPFDPPKQREVLKACLWAALFGAACMIWASFS